MNKAIIICGPTASGKTNFAHKLALENNGEIVNADSMQLYKQLPIITASPEQKLKDELPYHLYNFQDIDQELSATKYVELASTNIREISSRDKLPIIVGGSGMYISMLVNGYSAIPDIDTAIRAHTRALREEIGAEAFFAELKKLDPKITNILNVGDNQRTLRAYEIVKQTGKSILEFQAQENVKSLPDFEFEIIFLSPERKFLYDTCNKRLKILFDTGAIDEVRTAYEHFGEIKTTAMKALGVKEIIEYIKNNITLNETIKLASAKTRQYAKRQSTWFRNQITANQIIEFGSLEEYENKLEQVRISTRSK
jgi:tRNA dimethylallyltransferase